MKTCNACGTAILEGDICLNPLCKTYPQALWISRYASIVGISIHERAINELIQDGYLKDPSGFYTMERQALQCLRGFDEDFFFASVEASRAARLADVLMGIQIPYLSREQCLKIENVCQNLWAVAIAPADLLVQAPLALDYANSTVSFFDTPEITELVASLDAYSVGDANALRAEAKSAMPLKGKNIVFTGKLLSMMRARAQQLVTNSGGYAQMSVNRNTDILVTGDRVGSTKTTAAARYGTKIISEQDFLKMVGLA